MLLNTPKERSHARDKMLVLLSSWRVEEGLSAIREVYIHEKTEKSIGLKVPCRVHHPSPLSNRDFDTKYRRTKSHMYLTRVNYS